MKIIDLYIMLSKGEQPKKFKYRDKWYAYSVDDYDFRTLKQEYRDVDVPTYQYLMEIIDASNLNDEVEILEEEKKIPEEIEYYHQYDECVVKDEFYQDKTGSLVDEIIIDKVNEIIDYLKSKGDE